METSARYQMQGISAVMRIDIERCSENISDSKTKGLQLQVQWKQPQVSVLKNKDASKQVHSSFPGILDGIYLIFFLEWNFLKKGSREARKFIEWRNYGLMWCNDAISHYDIFILKILLCK